MYDKNEILPKIDHMIDVLIQCEFDPTEDVSWVALSGRNILILAISGQHFTCPVRHIECVKYRNIEFRESDWTTDTDIPYPVWNITSRTSFLFHNKGKKDRPQCQWKTLYRSK